MNTTCPECQHCERCLIERRCIAPATIAAAIVEMRAATVDMNRASERLRSAASTFEALRAINDASRTP